MAESLEELLNTSNRIEKLRDWLFKEMDEQLELYLAKRLQGNFKVQMHEMIESHVTAIDELDYMKKFCKSLSKTTIKLHAENHYFNQRETRTRERLSNALKEQDGLHRALLQQTEPVLFSEVKLREQEKEFNRVLEILQQNKQTQEVEYKTLQEKFGKMEQHFELSQFLQIEPMIIDLTVEECNEDQNRTEAAEALLDLHKP